MKTKRPLAALALCAAIFCGSAWAQSYPSKAMRFIVPVSPGSSLDVVARTIGQKLTESWGQPVVIDNVPGANTIIAAEAAAKAAPDGYTIIICGASTLVVNPSLYDKLPYNPARDFAPVSLVVLTPFVLVAHSSLRAQSVKALIELARSKPGKLDYASGGIGSSSHLSMELFKSMGQVHMTHIPYKGNTPALTDLLRGQVSLMFVDLLQALPHLKSGELKALGMAMAKRSPLAPDVPTVAEAGLPGFESTPWMGVLAPAGTNREIVARLSTEIVRIMRLAEVRERLLSQGVEPFGSTPEQFVAHLKSDAAKWARVIKTADIRLE
jgi:tripartite-type tricarboxylate transporter receptor subunit TctC